VEKVGDDYVAVAVADSVVIQVQKVAIQTVLPKGTIKSI
jgi:preprotein translocase subunit YajC